VLLFVIDTHTTIETIVTSSVMNSKLLKFPPIKKKKRKRNFEKGMRSVIEKEWVNFTENVNGVINHKVML
jgi:hypothetical protein